VEKQAQQIGEYAHEMDQIPPIYAFRVFILIIVCMQV
jgi:hypothetical protein